MFWPRGCWVQVTGGLVWILVASTHVEPPNPLGWVMFVSVFCFAMTLLWVVLFIAGCHKNGSAWVAAVRPQAGKWAWAINNDATIWPNIVVILLELLFFFNDVQGGRKKTESEGMRKTKTGISLGADQETEIWIDHGWGKWDYEIIGNKTIMGLILKNRD